MLAGLRRPLRLAALTGLCAALSASAAQGSAQVYTLDLPAGDMIAYKVEFHVWYPGRLVLSSDWDGYRVLSFNLTGPAGSSIQARRSGPPPQRLTVDVTPETTRLGGPWTLKIRGLPSPEASQGRLEVQFPDPAPEPAPVVEPPPEVKHVDEPWRLSRRAPRGSPAEWQRLYETTEQFRALTLEGDETVRDRYAWQEDFLRYMASKRDQLHTGEPLLTVGGRKSFERIVEAVERVDDLAGSKDPLVVGPPPEDPIRRRAWLRVRDAKVGSLARDLDRLHADLMEMTVDLPEDQSWMVRMVSCLTAVERHFEQRGRLGEDGAAHRELSREQWDRILAARDALESLTELGPPLPDTP